MSQTLQSVGLALKVLQLLRVRPEAGVTEIADELGIGSSTAHRLVATLQEHGFAEQTTARKYTLGPLMRLSPDAASVEHCIEMGEPAMRALRDASKETVHITVLSGTWAKFVAAVESPHMMRVTARVGLDVPAYTSASGKVLLAQLSQQHLLELYPEEELPAVTPNTIRTRSELMVELDGIRESGFARNFEESEIGLVAFAVPISRPVGSPVCSLTVTGPTARFSQSAGRGAQRREEELRRLLEVHAAMIERTLSY